MRILVLTNRPIKLQRHGYDLRVANLCRHLPGAKHLLHVPLAPPDARPATLDARAIFDSVGSTPWPLYGDGSFGRHLRSSEGSFLRLAFPSAFDATVRHIQGVVDATGTTHLLVFGGHLAEIARSVRCDRSVFDVCDSVCLTMRREDAHRPDGSYGQRLKRHLTLARWQQLEGKLAEWFSIVTTINEADTREIKRLSRRAAENVFTIPNGVDDGFLRPLPPIGRRRGVAFWGNLGFPPNSRALDRFVNEIYGPHLADKALEIAIVGSNPPEWLVRRAATDPNIKLLGFVDDLADAVSAYPVMVNPMVSGSGMKNKVLEAFALGLGVVSTSLGIESIAGAEAGVHYARADEAADFAAAVLSLVDEPGRLAEVREAAHRLVHERYRWQSVSEQLHRLLDA